MNKQKQLAKAIEVATEAHKGQFDKGGKPYILHPLHLMNQLMFDPELAAIAVMHDVIEDSAWDIGMLLDVGFSERVCNALHLLTHEKGHDYLDDYIQGICQNYDAIRVKRKDLQHNSDITRLKGVRDKDLRRINKYQKAFIILGEARTTFRG